MEAGIWVFDRLKEGLKKTKNAITERMNQVLVSFGKIDEELFEELEEILITSDVGIDTSMQIIENQKKVKENKVVDPQKVKELLKEK